MCLQGLIKNIGLSSTNIIVKGPRGRDRMLVWFINTYAISAYHH